MKHKTKNFLRALAKHFGLKIVFVHYFPDEVHGKLLTREKRILINARKPRCEHVFTLLHEIAHHVLHVLNPHRKRHPRIFDIHWKNDFLARFSSYTRRSFRFIFSKESRREWEADVWAMCAFVYLARFAGGRDELKAYLERHPEKTNMILLVACATAYTGIKTRIKNMCKQFLFPLSAAFRRSS